MAKDLTPLVTEKAVMLIEAQNTLAFKASKEMTKTEAKREVESMFKVKVSSVRAMVKANKKYFYVRLRPEFLAIDVATKIGMI